MVKVQLLLQQGVASDDPELWGRLRTYGMNVRGSGRVTLSASISEADFHKLFGSTSSASISDSLPIPADLCEAIAAIVVTPRHILMSSKESEG